MHERTILLLNVLVVVTDHVQDDIVAGLVGVMLVGVPVRGIGMHLYVAMLDDPTFEEDWPCCLWGVPGWEMCSMILLDKE